MGEGVGLGRARIGAYGPMTGEALRELGARPAAVAADHKTGLILEVVSRACGARGEDKADEARGADGARGLRGLRFLVVRGDARLATEAVPEALAGLGASADVAQGCAVAPESRDLSGDAADMLANGADWVVFATAQAIGHFDGRFGLRNFLGRFPGARVALTNATLCAALKKAGGVAAVVARPNDPGDLVDKLRGWRDGARFFFQ